MATIVTRAGKGSPLTNAEVDSNFTYLNTDKFEAPSQTGNSGKFLTTNGTAASWADVPAPNDGTLTMVVSGTGLSGSASFTANQTGSSTFTVTSNATSANPVGAIVARDGSGDFTARNITANAVTGLVAPTNTSDAANKAYVDEVAEGLLARPAVEIATTANLDATYNNGTSGVGATLTANSNGAFPTIDGVTLSSTTPGENGVLVKNQTSSLQNGRYNLTTVGDAGTPWVLTRCGLCDESDEIAGSYMFVKRGTLYASTGWVLTVADPATFTVGTDNILVVQFSGAGTYTAGTGLTLTGSSFSITNTGTAGTYGSATQVPVFTTNAQGQVTGVVNTNLSTPQVLTAGTGLSTDGTFDGSTARTFSVSYGTSAGTACQGNDSRLSDARQATNSNTQLASLGVGTAASGTAGEIRATNNVTAYYSDDRLKTKLGGIENALDKDCALSGFYHEANETAQELGYKPVREVGVSAQEVQVVMPEVVAPAPIDDKYLTVRYERMVPLLVEAIKELKAEIDALKRG